jgi:hypothetical protein
MLKMVKHYKQQHKLQEVRDKDLTTDGKPFKESKKSPKPSILFQSFCDVTAPLIYGTNTGNLPENTEKQRCNGNDIVKAIKQCRLSLDSKDQHSEISLEDLQSKYVQKKIQAISDDHLTERLSWKKKFDNLQIENDELQTKVEELENELEHEHEGKDRIIRETVDRIVKERLLFLFVCFIYSHLSNFSAIRRLSPLPVMGLQI